jgi:hypothetical protein
MTTKVVSVQDGPRITVAAMVKSPTIIPARIISDLQQMFIVDALLRKLPPTDSGMVQYDESTPLFADGNAEIVEEFGEIPTIGGRVGARKVAFTVKRALAMLVSQEMVNRNNIDRVNKQIKQIRNTMVRTWETTFFQALLNHPDVQSYNVTNAWDVALGKPQLDLAEAGLLIENAAPADDPDNYYGFEPNTLVVGKRTKTDLIQNDKFNSVFRQAGLAQNAPEYKGTLPGEFYGLRIMVSRELDRLAPGKALLLEAKTVGGISDERPLRATPLYDDKPRETWRSDTVRQSAVVIDQPKAAVWLNNVGT